LPIETALAVLLCNFNRHCVLDVFSVSIDKISKKLYTMYISKQLRQLNYSHLLGENSIREVILNNYSTSRQTLMTVLF